jgi:hypothetical protein
MRGRDSISWDTLTNVFSKLSNASSSEIRKGLAGLKFYLRVTNDGTRPITLVSEDKGVSHRDAYEENVLAESRQDGIFQRFSRAFP